MMGLLERVIATLPAKLRDPLILSTVEEMSPSDIASALGINESAVRSRLFRGREMLKTKLAVLLEASHGT
jgi:RNA polymerase sigma-70 factor (ECF subfamily)